MVRLTIISEMPSDLIIIPDHVRKLAEDSVGEFFERVAGTSRSANAQDHLGTQKSLKRAGIIERFTPLSKKKLLEIGSGYGSNLAVWIKEFGVDGYGIERDAEGFGNSFQASRELFLANEIDPNRIIRSEGDTLPFADFSFDIVYAANVLEHTDDPVKMVEEAVRVLRPGGIFHTEIPNFLSYFEGHYFVPQPPILFRWMLPAWVKLLGRDPAFAHTLRTEINPLWCRKAIDRISAKYEVKLVSLGQEIFLDRLAQPFAFEMERTASKLARTIALIQVINVGNWIGRLIVLAQGYYPMYLTVLRKPL
jgi:SAM-dependent methyltransferase